MSFGGHLFASRHLPALYSDRCRSLHAPATWCWVPACLPAFFFFNVQIFASIDLQSYMTAYMAYMAATYMAWHVHLFLRAFEDRRQSSMNDGTSDVHIYQCSSDRIFVHRDHQSSYMNIYVHICTLNIYVWWLIWWCQLTDLDLLPIFAFIYLLYISSFIFYIFLTWHDITWRWTSPVPAACCLLLLPLCSIFLSSCDVHLIFCCTSCTS